MSVAHERQLGARRRELLSRLFTDPSFSAVEAMKEMTFLTEEYVEGSFESKEQACVWLGGSLGRREMLPNSDLDLFLIHPDGEGHTVPPSIRGFDRVEVGRLSVQALSELASRSLIDVNQFVDGRPLSWTPTATAVASILHKENTYDRQHANLITEYFYFRHFDFPNKRTPHGANIKYSSGSARMTLFFNFLYRIVSGEQPATRSLGPEFLDGVAAFEDLFDTPGPYRELDMIQVVKNAAIFAFDATADVRQRYISRSSLERIYELCETRFRGLGMRDSDSFLHSYVAARVRVETAVDILIEETMSNHRSMRLLRAIADAPAHSVSGACRDAVGYAPQDASTILAFGAWHVVTREGVAQADVTALSRFLLSRPVSETGGALMAIACSPSASHSVLENVISHVLETRAGSYALKLITRNTHTSSDVRARALAAYTEMEFVQDF